MTRKDLADAFNLLAEAAVKVALELEGLEAPAAGTPPPAPTSAARGSGEAPAAATEFTHCPKHGKEFKPLKNPGWGAFCTAMSDDPAWSNDKGYCRITSKNAGEWLAVHGRAA